MAAANGAGCPNFRSDDEVTLNTGESKILPNAITSYDLLKSFALITMIIDHVGHYLFPEQIGWRLVGRMSLPVWLFLIGYARSREIPTALVAGAFVILASNLVFGENLLPLNILFTIVVARLIIDRLMKVALDGLFAFALVTYFLALLTPSLSILDYGTHALLFAMFGYLVRHQDALPFPRYLVYVFALVACTVQAFTQAELFGASTQQSIYVWFMITAVGAVLCRFRAAEFPGLTRRLGILPSAALRLMGRHTLLLYVVHLLVLKVVAAWWLWPEGWLFDWHLFMPQGDHHTPTLGNL